MKLKAFSLRWGDQGFETDAFDRFVHDHDILSMTEHLVVHEGVPWWCILVSARARDRAPVLGPPPFTASPESPQLAPDERLRYDALRRWRNDRARQDGKPPYVLFTNQQMISIAQRNPQSLSELGDIPGVGPARQESWGGEVLAVLESLRIVTNSAPVENLDG